MARLPVRDWCDALGMTQAALGRRAWITAAVISDDAHGRRNPTLRTIEALARAIERQPWEFLRGPLPGEGLPDADEARRQNLAGSGDSVPRSACVPPRAAAVSRSAPWLVARLRAGPVHEDDVDPARFLMELSRAGVRWLLIGRQALIHYGVPLQTMDYDLWIDPAPANVEKLLHVAREVGLEAPETARGRRRR